MKYPILETKITYNMLAKLNDDLWDELNVNSGSELRGNAKKYEMFIEKVNEFLRNKGIVSISRNIYNKLEDNNIHTLNLVLENLGMYSDWKESKKSARKSLKESRDSILDKEFYDLVKEGYIYDEDENGMNMSYGEYATVSDDLWEVLEDELKSYRDFPSAYDAYVEIMDNTSDDAKMFMGVSDEDYFYFSIDEDEGTYDFDGEVPFILEKLFKEFQKETDLERA